MATHGIPVTGVVKGSVLAVAVRDSVLSLYVRRGEECFFLDLSPQGARISRAQCIEVNEWGWGLDEGRVVDVFTGLRVRRRGMLLASGPGFVVFMDGGRLRRRVVLQVGERVFEARRLVEASASYWAGSLILRGSGKKCIVASSMLGGATIIHEASCSDYMVFPGVLAIGNHEECLLVTPANSWRLPLSVASIKTAVCSVDGGLCLVCGQGELCLLISEGRGVQSVRLPGGAGRYLPLPGRGRILLVPRIAGGQCIEVRDEGVERGMCRHLVFADLVGGAFMASFQEGGVLRVDDISYMAAVLPWILLVREKGAAVIMDTSRYIAADVRLGRSNEVIVDIHGVEDDNNLVNYVKEFRVSICSSEGGDCILRKLVIGAPLHATLPPTHFPRSLVRVFLEPRDGVAGVVREELVSHRGVDVRVSSHAYYRLLLHGADYGELYVHVADIIEDNPYPGAGIRYEIPGSVFFKLLRRGKRVRLIAVSSRKAPTVKASLRGVPIHVLGAEEAEYRGEITINLNPATARVTGVGEVEFGLEDPHIIHAECVSACRETGTNRFACRPGCMVRLVIKIPEQIRVRLEATLDRLLSRLLEELSAEYTLLDVDLVNACIDLQVERDGWLIVRGKDGGKAVYFGAGSIKRLCKPVIVAVETPKGNSLTLPDPLKPRLRITLEGRAITLLAPGCTILLCNGNGKKYTVQVNNARLDAAEALRGVMVKVYYPGGVQALQLGQRTPLLLAARAAYILAERLKLLNHIGSNLLHARQPPNKPAGVEVES